MRCYLSFLSDSYSNGIRIRRRWLLTFFVIIAARPQPSIHQFLRRRNPMVVHEPGWRHRHEFLRWVGLVALRIHDYYYGSYDVELPDFNYQQNVWTGYFEQKPIYVQ